MPIFPRTIALLSVLVGLVIGTAPAVAQSERADTAPITAGGEGVGAPILPGDQITLRIYQEPELSGVYTVAENHEVVLPKLGSLSMRDQSAGELQTELRTRYARYLRNPSVEVTVLRRIGVYGEVRRPDLYMVDLTMTLRELVARAGGLTEAADPDRVIVVRGNERIRLGKDGLTLAATDLRSGDQVVVDRKSYVALKPFDAVNTGIGTVTAILGLVTLLATLATR